MVLMIRIVMMMVFVRFGDGISGHDPCANIFPFCRCLASKVADKAVHSLAYEEVRWEFSTLLMIRAVKHVQLKH